MNAESLIQARHSLHMERLRKWNRLTNAGEERPGLGSHEEDAAAAAAIVDELEHIADVLGIPLEERRG